MNSKKLLDFADWLEENIKEEQFNFEATVSAYDYEIGCGTVCCAIGWLPLFDERIKWVDGTSGGLVNLDGYDESYDVAASKVFEMNREDAGYLFCPESQADIEDWGDYPVCGDMATPKELANAIRHYVEIQK